MSKLGNIRDQLQYRAAHRQEAIWDDVTVLAEECVRTEDDFIELIDIVRVLVDCVEAALPERRLPPIVLDRLVERLTEIKKLHS